MANPRVVAAALALVPFTSIGLARFAYGLILPEMRSDLGWSYFEAGVVTTGNAAGYLAGAAMGAAMARRYGEWWVIVVGVAGMALSLVLTSAVSSLSLIVVFRFLAGLFGGWSFVAGSTRAAQLSRAGAPSALIWYPAGAGMAVVISAAGQSIIEATVEGWRVSWLALGALGVLSAVVLAVIVPQAEQGAAPQRSDVAAREKGLEFSYGLFGLGYISYVTFVVAYVKTGDSGLSPVVFWGVLGAASVAAAFLWPPLFAKYTAGAMYPLTLAICSAGVFAIIISRSSIGAMTSAILVGGSFLAVVSGVTASARDRVRPDGWASAIGWLTVVFGAGQTLGPLLGGALGDSDAGLRLGLGASAAILAAGAVVASVDRRAALTAQA